MTTLLLVLLLAQPVSTVGTNPVQPPDREQSPLVVFCERHRCELVLHVSAADHELEGPYIYLYLRPDVGHTAMCSGEGDGTLMTWLRAHRNETIVLSVSERGTR